MRCEDDYVNAIAMKPDEDLKVSAQKLSTLLQELKKDLPQAVYPFDEYADLVDALVQRIADYDDALFVAGEEYCETMKNVAPEDMEEETAEELVIHWKDVVGIPRKQHIKRNK